jgi:hypothetical protein
VLSENSPVIEVARDVRRVLEGRFGVKLELNIEEFGAARSYRVDGSKARQVLGFQPAAAFAGEVETMWGALEHGVDFNQPHHYNIRWLELLCEMRDRLVTRGEAP